MSIFAYQMSLVLSQGETNGCEGGQIWARVTVPYFHVPLLSFMKRFTKVEQSEINGYTAARALFTTGVFRFSTKTSIL